MNQNENKQLPRRQYPPFFEKFVPVALGLIAVLIVVLLVIITGVALGFFG